VPPPYETIWQPRGFIDNEIAFIQVYPKPRDPDPNLYAVVHVQFSDRGQPWHGQPASNYVHDLVDFVEGDLLPRFRPFL
jgi:hypothetical protein